MANDIKSQTLEEFADSPKFFKCSVCQLGDPVVDDIRKGLDILANPKNKKTYFCMAKLYDWLAANRDFVISRTTFKNHIRTCEKERYSKIQKIA